MAWDINTVPDPWGQSIYQFIETETAESGTFGSFSPPFPNERWPCHCDRSREVPDGAVDGVAKALVRLSQKSTPRTAVDFYQALSQLYVWGDGIARVLSKVVAVQPDLDRLGQIGMWLARNAPDSNATLFGAALLRWAPPEPATPVLLMLGTHDAFSDMAIEVLAGFPDGEQLVFALAKRQHEWGRIEAIQLLKDSEDAEIKQWFITDGYSNAILDEEIAYVCAVAGELRRALEPEEVDDDILKGAGGIIVALINGGPAEDIHDYEDGVVVIRRYLDLLEHREGDLDEWRVVHTICTFVEDQPSWFARFAVEPDWTRLEPIGWTAEARDEIRKKCEAFFARPHFPGLIVSGLAAASSWEHHLAITAARYYEIDAYEDAYKRIVDRVDPFPLWQDLIEVTDGARLERTLTLARGDQERSAVFIVQGLKRFPGEGNQFVIEVLRSDSRSIALHVLESWPRLTWPTELEKAVAEAIQIEPDDQLRERMIRLLGNLSQAACTLLGGENWGTK